MNMLKPYLLLIGLMMCNLGQASEDMEIHDPWIRAAPPESPMAGYFLIHNRGGTIKQLIGASAQGFAMTMIHESKNVDGLMKMQHLHMVEIAAGDQVMFKPGGYHLMLMQPEKNFHPGDKIPVELEFSDGSTLQVMFLVKSASQVNDTDQDSHADHSSHQKINHDHGHDKKHIVRGEYAPHLMMKIQKEDIGSWMIMLETKNFIFSEAHQDGEHVEGEGHGHLYINGEKFDRVFSNHYMLPHLEPGTYEVTVGLFTNNHMAYWTNGHPIRKSVTIIVD